MEERFEPEVIVDYLDNLDKDYLYELSCLQVEMIQLQKHIMDSKMRLLVIFEGRDTAGKGGAIIAFSQHLNPRHLRIVALPKPTEAERGQWYFQRYLEHLPDAGEVAFFDRSWYNRAVVEPVMGFCTDEQHERFLAQVSTLEKLLVDDGIHLVKFWYSIEYQEQLRRVEDRKINPLKRWKLSPVDQAAADKWDVYTAFKEKMFARTSSERCPWHIVNGNERRVARLESMRFVLSRFDYPNKGLTGQRLTPDSNVVTTRTS